MTHSGYHWTIRPEGSAWRWSLFTTAGDALVGGLADTRPIAAACALREIICAMAETPEQRDLAA